ncbi:MAG: VCBS repeat-containing protein, partial [Kangiellaceae bacterium]|nr:VCBS repeat-containing protein [Kangiellaceae bacterium]
MTDSLSSISKYVLLIITLLFTTSSFSFVEGLPLSPPSSVTVPSTSNTGNYTVNWSSVSGATFYKWSEEVNGVWDTTWVRADSNSVSLTDRANGTYRYKVRACSSAASCGVGSIASNTITVNTLTIPGSVSSISADENYSTDGHYVVSWGAASNSPTRYEWKEMINGVWEGWTSAGMSSSVSINNRGDGTYDYKVRACNSAGCGSDIELSGTVTVALLIGGSGWKNTGGSVPDAAWSGDTTKVTGNLGVGALEGSAGVSGGAATYFIPIAIPPGRNGVQPSVGLSYSSRGGNGIVGQGWSLSTGSSIHRCSGIYAVDNDNWRNVTLSSTDKLCLDGQRLKLYSGSYGVSGAYYHPELDPTTRIRQYNGINSGSAYFTVETKSGGKSFYGNSSDSRLIRQGTTRISSWLLKKSEDKPGKNNIIYTYDAQGDIGAKYLIRINYTGFNGSQGDRIVEFNYQTRPDVRFDYLANTYSKSTKRLHKVFIKVGAQTVSEFRLIYRDSADAINTKLSLTTQEWVGESASSGASNTPQTSKRKSLLDSVELCAWDANGLKECLPRSVFDMEYWKAGVKAQALIKALSDEAQRTGSLATGDFDGDAKADYIFNHSHSLSSGMGLSVNISSTGGWKNITSLVNQHNTRKHSVNGLTIDYNLDGKTDFIGSHVVNGINYLSLVYWDKNAASFVPKTTSIEVDCGYNSSNSLSIGSHCQSYTVDFDGDGKTDIIAAKRQAKTITLTLYRNTHLGGGNSAPSFQQLHSLQVSSSSRPIPSPFVQADIDGDGRTELVGVRFLGGMIQVENYELETGETFLSYPDRETAIVSVVNAGGSWQLTLNTYNNHLFEGDPGLTQSDQYIDINGDGLADILDTTNAFNCPEFSSHVQECSMSEQYSNNTTKSSMINGIWINKGGASNNHNNYYSVATPVNIKDAKPFDYNGDGLTDFLYKKSVAYMATGCGVEPNINSQDEDMSQWWACVKQNTIFNWAVLQTQVTSSGELEFIDLGEQEIAIQAAEPYLYFADHNGDGAVDILAQKGFSEMSSNDALGFYVYENPNPVADKLIKVTRGGDMGLVDEFAYDSLTSLDSQGRYSYDVKQDFPYVDFTTATQMVDTYKTSDGIGGLRDTRFSYTDARYHLQGRGFQGFGSITEEHITLGTKTTSTFEQDFPYSGKVSQVDNYAKNNSNSYQLISRVNNTWSNSANQNAYLVYLNDSDRHHYDLQSGNFLYRKIDDVISIDGWGNVSDKKSTYTESNSGSAIAPILANASVTQVTSSAFSAQCSWIPNQPSWTQVSSNAVASRGSDYAIPEPGTDFSKTVRTTINSWDVDYCTPTSVTTSVITGGGHPTTVNTVYNSYGLPTLVTTKGKYFSGSNMPDRVVTTGYTTDGYFVNSIKNTLNHETTTVTDPIHGQATQVTDPNGQVTTMTYDAFGRVRSTKLPGEPTQWVAYYWPGGNVWVDSKAKYVIRKTQLGSPESRIHFDMFNRPIREGVESFQGRSVDWVVKLNQYNNLGQLVSETQLRDKRDDNSWTYTYYDSYDALGRLTKKRTSQANDSHLLTTYSYNGFVTDINAGGLLMARKYNGLGQLVWTRDADQNYTRYAYDGAGNPIVLQDANGNPITAKYNALGHKEWVKDPNMGTKSFWYNTLGEVDKEIDANGDVLTYRYDSLGRMDRRWTNGVYSGVWSYDSTAAYGRKGMLDYEWNSNANNNQDRLTKYYRYATTASGKDYLSYNAYYVYENGNIPESNKHVIYYYMDNNYGRPKGMKYNTTGLTLAYDYNDRGYMTKVKNANGGYVYQEIQDLDAHGKVTSQLMTNGLITQTANYHAATGQMT